MDRDTVVRHLTEHIYSLKVAIILFFSNNVHCPPLTISQRCDTEEVGKKIPAHSCNIFNLNLRIKIKQRFDQKKRYMSGFWAR